MSRQPKPPPEDSWANLFHPRKGYPYFEGGDQAENTFVVESTGFELINAWWLAEMAMLAYESKPDVEKYLRAGGFDDVQTFGVWKESMGWLARLTAFLRSPRSHGTQGYVARGKGRGGAHYLVVAFRGTEKDDIEDLLTDLNAKPVKEDDGLVHKGFKKALDGVWPDLQTVLDRLSGNELPIFFTGHSLGAALATLAAGRYKGNSRISLYSFGSPRVGNKDFCQRVSRKTDGRSYRFVNNQDVVTLVAPECSYYEHCPTEKYIDAHFRIRDGLTPVERWQDAIPVLIEHDDPLIRKTTETLIGSPPISLLRKLLEFFSKPESGLNVPPYIVGNHSPERYTVHIWNNLC